MSVATTQKKTRISTGNWKVKNLGGVVTDGTWKLEQLHTVNTTVNKNGLLLRLLPSNSVNDSQKYA